MKRVVNFIQGTRRFRYTLTLLLIFGALFAINRTRSQESDSGVMTGSAQVVATASSQSGSASPYDVAQVEPEAGVQAVAIVGTAEEDLQKKAQVFLEALSKHVSKSATPEPSRLPMEVTELAYRGEKAETTEGDLCEMLSDSDSAGEFIHDLRMRGFVPVKSIRWIRPVADPALESDAGVEASEASEKSTEAVVWGIVTVDDKLNPNVPNWEPRSRAVKITFKGSGDDVLLYEIKHPTARELGAIGIAERFIGKMKTGDSEAAWLSGSKEMQASRTAQQVHDAMGKAGFLRAESIEWENETAIEGGYKLNGVLNLGNGTELSFYVAFLETKDGLKILDFQATDSFLGRVIGGRGDTLDIVLAVVALAMLLGFLYIIISYVRGLWGSPRELYILFFTKLTEYSAYGAAHLTFMFYLREDLGLGDIGAGTYYSTWSTIVTATTMIVGAVCDTIGVKKTLIIGSVLLLVSRVVMPFSDNIWVVSLLGFVPLGIGVAITGPVLSVGIKRFTTVEGAALGFGLFYTLMNVGWAVGAKIFDVVRINMGELGRVDFLGDSLSTWQVLFGIGFFINLPDLLAILWMRDGVEMTEDGIKFPEKKPVGEGASSSAPLGSMGSRTMASLRAGAVGSAKVFTDNFVQRAFWVFILLIGITVFARLTFFHFHITWPSYGIRYFGQGSLVGNVFGVLNPLIIVFLVPVVAYLTRKVRSYWLLLVGTIITVASVAFVVIPPQVFAGLTDTWFGVMVFDRWLEVPVGNRDPFYLSMVLFIH